MLHISLVDDLGVADKKLSLISPVVASLMRLLF